MNEDRTRFNVEVYRTDKEYDSLVETTQVDTIEEATEVVVELEEEGKLDWPKQVRINKVVSLDAPLTEEEEQELQGWIDNLGGEATDGSDEDTGLARTAPGVERQV